MSSRQSRRMGLGLILAGAGTLSGCWAAGAAWILQEDANSKRAAEAQKEAARTIADAVKEQKNSSPGNYEPANGVQGDRNSNDPRIIYFTCSRVIDLNNDDINDISENSNEVMDRGKTEFYVGDDYLYVAKLYNCKGRNVQIFSQCSLGGEVQGSNVYKIQKNPYNMVFGGKAEVSGSWHTYITMDDIKIADFRVNVKEDPARPISKK